jgi:energy-coupling factor transporter transmembrane protein EcfT
MKQIAGVQPVKTSLQAIDGRVKTLLCLTAIVVAAVLSHWYLAAVMMLVAVILLLRQNYSLKMLCLRLVIPFGVAWLVLLSFLLTYGHIEIGRITIFHLVFPLYLEGLERGFVITLRLLAAVCIITLLSVTTPMPEIMADADDQSTRPDRRPGRDDLPLYHAHGSDRPHHEARPGEQGRGQPALVPAGL